MPNKPVPPGIKITTFNNHHASHGRIEKQDIPIVRFTPGLLLLGYELPATLIAIAAMYDKRLKNKVFSSKGFTHRIVKVFAAENEIRMRVTVEPVADVEEPVEVLPISSDETINSFVNA